MINQTYNKHLILDDYEILKMSGADQLLPSFSAHKNHFNNSLFDYNIQLNELKTDIIYFMK